jgi:hypothetical protein
LSIPGRLPKALSEPGNFAGFANARDPLAWQDRRRGLSNFLTWAFFLAEILAADLFFGKAASAADALDAPSKHAAADTHSSGDASLPDDWKNAGDDALPTDADRLFHSEAAPLDPHYSETAAIAALGDIGSQEPAFLGSAGGGGGGGSSTFFSQDPALLSTDPGEQAIHSGEAPSIADMPSIDLGVAGDVFSMLDTATAAALGLELNPLQFELGFGADPFSGTSPDATLDLKALGLDVHVETGLLSGLLGDLGSTGGEVLGDNLGSPVSQLVEEATGLNVSGPVEALQGLLATAEDNLGKASLTDIADGTDSPSVFSTVGVVAGIMPDTLDILGHVEVGGVFSTVSAVAPALPDATDALSIGQMSGVGSGQSIVFPLAGLQDQGATDSLFSGGQYTDYNLALQTAPSDGAGAAGAAESPSDAVSDLAGIATDDLGLPGSEPTGHAIDATLTGLANADHELLRGLSI